MKRVAIVLAAVLATASFANTASAVRLAEAPKSKPFDNAKGSNPKFSNGKGSSAPVVGFANGKGSNAPSVGFSNGKGSNAPAVGFGNGKGSNRGYSVGQPTVKAPGYPTGYSTGQSPKGYPTSQAPNVEKSPPVMQPHDSAPSSGGSYNGAAAKAAQEAIDLARMKK